MRLLQRLPQSFDPARPEQAQAYLNTLRESWRDISAGITRNVWIILLLLAGFELAGYRAISTVTLGPLVLENLKYVRIFVPTIVGYLFYEQMLLATRWIESEATHRYLMHMLSPNIEEYDFDALLVPRWRWCEGHAGGGEHAQVEGPLAGRALPPQREGVTSVGSSLLVCHAGDGVQVGEGLVGLALDLGESEMCDGVALVAQADQAAQRLHPGRFVVDPAFVCFQPSPGGWVRSVTAGFAAVPGPVGDHTAESFPVPEDDAGADVGEPAREGTRSMNRPEPSERSSPGSRSGMSGSAAQRARSVTAGAGAYQRRIVGSHRAPIWPGLSLRRAHRARPDPVGLES
jgi:hypothetical protein